MAKKIIGTVTSYHGDEHRYLRSYRVRIVAVFKDLEGEEDEGAYITDDQDLARAGGVTPADRIEVQPWLEAEGRYSFVTSDPRAADLACFAGLTGNGGAR